VPARRPGDHADPDEPLEAGDELLFVTHADVEEQLQQVLAPTF
jgi:trk system potassium uptake protein TrkA